MINMPPMILISYPFKLCDPDPQEFYLTDPGLTKQKGGGLWYDAAR